LRLGLVDLGLRLLDLLALAVGLGLNVIDIRLRDGGLCLGLIDRNPVVAVVDPRQRLAGIDVLIVGDGDIGDIAADFRRDGEAARGNEGVIRRFEMANVEPIRDATGQNDQQDARRHACQQPVLPQPIAQGWR
jgi:hypothetical protein